MSSFSAKVAQAEKKKKSVQGDAVTASSEELYGEDQVETLKHERMIPLARIRPNPFQPRKTFDPTKLDELAAGMREHGWIGGGLPVRAHASEANVYELVWGERRWRAAAIAELEAIPCVVSIYSDDDMIEKGLLENIQREDLSNLEEGQAYVNLLALRNEQGRPRYSIRRLAQRIGKDKSYIEDRLQYARVPLDVQQLAIDQPDISPRIIRELGELSKILRPEERASVVAGVREGGLRIEDVREIRKDIERQSEPTILPVTTQVSVATDTSAVTEQSDLPTDPIPAARVVTVSVFEKGLKRDSEAVERIFQRITDRYETLTGDERIVLQRYLQRWNVALQALMDRPEATHDAGT